MHSSKKILIVEDEAINSMYLELQFRTRGFSVCETSSNSRRTIELFKDERPDLILMDICIEGDTDGIETSKILKKENPVIPIIFITGYVDERTKKRAMEVEPLSFLMKPIDIEKLFSVIENYFETKTAAD